MKVLSVNEALFLDSTPLWLACLSKNSRNPERDKCVAWLNSLLTNGNLIVIPEITDYEVRRKFNHFNLKHRGQWAGHIRRLDALKSMCKYLPLNTQMMLKAAELWA